MPVIHVNIEASAPKFPDAFLPLSVVQLPAFPVPVQARKRGRQAEIPFQFTVLFEKNIESFSEWQPVGVMSFLLLPPAFPSLDGSGPGGRELAR